MQIILASRSVRRKRLLRQIISKFTCVRPDEPARKAGTVAAQTLRLAKAKAQTVAGKHPNAVVISADTLLSCRGKILGKPRNMAQARKMLLAVSGRIARASTSVCVFSSSQKACWSEKASIRFKPIKADALERYLASGEWRGKAGGFNIEEKPVRDWVAAISGDKNVVVGLPLKKLKKEIKTVF